MFALYEQYGVPNASGVGIDVMKTEVAIRAAFVADPNTMRPIINAEIEHYLPLVDRDASSRAYISLLRRCMGEVSDLEAQHAEKMKAALALIETKKVSPAGGSASLTNVARATS